MTDDNHEVHADQLRMARLDDDGLPGYVAVVGITADGEEILALAHRAGCGTNAPAYPNDWRKVAPHELTGRLPRKWASLLHRPTTEPPECRPRTQVEQAG